LFILNDSHENNSLYNFEHIATGKISWEKNPSASGFLELSVGSLYEMNNDPVME